MKLKDKASSEEKRGGMPLGNFTVLHVKKSNVCHDCGARKGHLHGFGCDHERCPFCGGQLEGCSCIYRKFYWDTFREQIWVNELGRFVGHPTSGLSKEVYENGAPERIKRKWRKILDKKGRVLF